MKDFNELNLSQPLKRAILELGFERPSPIQEQALPFLLGEPTDFLGLAATGTGKTAAFAIPLLEKTNSSRKSIQTIVLCPTRELAIQVAEQISALGKYLGVRSLAVYGGAGFFEQMKVLKKGIHVLVGTPGRVIDHINRGNLSLAEVDRVILDEADEMISMGFKDDLKIILNQIPKGLSNIWLFSATMSAEVRKVADEYLSHPKQVQVNKSEVLPKGVEQVYYVTQESNKPEVLCKIIDFADQFYGLVFCQTKSLVMELTQYLVRRSYRVDCLHGDMDQKSRERVIRAFKDRKLSVLICTDVASRGLDVKDMTHVVNYSIPRELDVYVHRIGRTARSGKTGCAISLLTGSHRNMIPRIEKITKRQFKEGKIPTRKEIGFKKLLELKNVFQKQSNYMRAIELMGKSWQSAIDSMTPEEISGRFLTMLLPEIFSEREDIDSTKSTKIIPRSFRNHEAPKHNKKAYLVQ